MTKAASSTAWTTNTCDGQTRGGFHTQDTTSRAFRKHHKHGTKTPHAKHSEDIHHKQSIQKTHMHKVGARVYCKRYFVGIYKGKGKSAASLTCTALEHWWSFLFEMRHRDSAKAKKPFKDKLRQNRLKYCFSSQDQTVGLEPACTSAPSLPLCKRASN